MPSTRAGICTLVGKPNAGKSTLLNRLVGQTLAITSPKPQSTRDRIVGILSDDTSQIVLFDTPGLLEPRHALHESMRGSALSALRDADVIVYLHDASAGDVPPLEELAGLPVAPTAKRILALTKSDLVPTDRRATIAALHPDAVICSPRTGRGIDRLLTRIRESLPESPFLYDPEDVSTQQLRFFASEFIREAALERLDEEVPHALACEVEEFREDRSPVYIRATLYVERDSQKRILIGAGGARLKSIGTGARQRIEKLIESKVFLDLWVKVLPNWRRDPAALSRLGYQPPEPIRR